MRRVLAATGLAGLIAATAVTVAATPAGAIMTGACTATVQGIDVAGLPVDDPAAAIKVPEGASLSYAVSSPAVVRSRNLVLSFAGVDVTIDRGTSTGQDGGSRGDTVAIDDYAWMGAGLYQVAGVGRLGDGTTCTGAVLIEVGGNPLASAGGAIGLILTVLGTAGIIVGAIRQGGGRLVRDLIDLIELQGPEGIEELVGGRTGTTEGSAPGATPSVGDGATGEAAGAGAIGTSGETPPADAAEGSKEPTGAGAGATPGGGAAGGGAATSEPTAPPPPDPGSTAPVEPATSSPAPEPSAEAESAESKPPPLPGMEAIGTVGTTATALSEATEQLEGHIDELPISDEQKEKLKETLATGTIKEKLDAINGVVETVQHFEAMGTETVDRMNRWGVNANGINGLLWLRTMAEASGRLGQKAVDGIVTPVIEPIAKGAEQLGIKADAEEITHSLLPVQEFAEEAGKAMVNGAESFLGGQQVLAHVGDKEFDEEWRNIRRFP